MKTFRNFYLAVFKAQPLFITHRIGWQQLFYREISRFGDNHVKGFFIKILEFI